jgi:hypothetical protein
MSTHSKVEVFSLAFGRKGGWSMAARERDGWLSDFSLVLSREHFRSVRRDPEYEVFSGSKPLALLWLVVVAAVGGALGGTLVSGALWGPWWQVPAWIVVLVATATIVAYDDYRVPATWEVASFNPGTSEQEKCELALCDIVSRLQQCFDISK